MANIENFSEKEELNNDLERVGAVVERNREALESEGFEKREIVKKSVSEMADENVINESDAVETKKSVSEEESYLPDYIADEEVDDEVKRVIEALLQVALDKGISKALKHSKKYPPFIQDAFHDALADKLVPELERRGII